MSDTMDDYKFHAEMTRAQKKRNIETFLRVMRRLNIHVNKMGDDAIHCKIKINNELWNVWPSVSKMRRQEPYGSSTLEGMHYFYKKYLNVPEKDIQILEKKITLRPSVYEDAMLCVEDGMHSLLAIHQCCLTMEEVVWHSIAWKYFFGPYINPKVVWGADSQEGKLFPHIEFDGYIAAKEHGLWNNDHNTIEARMESLYLMKLIAEDEAAYEEIF